MIYKKRNSLFSIVLVSGLLCFGFPVSAGSSFAYKVGRCSAWAGVSAGLISAVALGWRLGKINQLIKKTSSGEIKNDLLKHVRQAKGFMATALLVAAAGGVGIWATQENETIEPVLAALPRNANLALNGAADGALSTISAGGSGSNHSRSTVTQLTRLSFSELANVKDNFDTVILPQWPDVNKVNESFGLTLLMLALYHGNLPLVNWLISRGADVNVSAQKTSFVKTGTSALYLGFASGNIEIVETLLAHGARVYKAVKDDINDMELIYYLKFRRKEVIDEQDEKDFAEYKAKVQALLVTAQLAAKE